MQGEQKPENLKENLKRLCVNEISCLAFREDTGPQCVIRHDGHDNISNSPRDSQMVIKHTAKTVPATLGKEKKT